MGTVVDLSQAPSVDVAVDLRCRQRAVAEQLLDHPQVGAALEQVCREGVAQAMRVRDDPAERARVQSLPPGRQKQRVRGAGGKLRAAVTEIEPEAVGSLLAERDDALLA